MLTTTQQENKLLIIVTALMDLKGIMLSENSQSQNIKCSLILFINIFEMLMLLKWRLDQCLTRAG
jgi:hypothetical protein